MIPEHHLHWLKLAITPGLGTAGVCKLLDAFGTPQAALAAAEARSIPAHILSSALCDKLKTPDQASLEQSISWLEASENHHLLCFDEPQYPALLKTTPDAPPILFVNGDVTVLSQFQVAIVGSRNASRNGYDTAYEFANYLAKTGMVITSGLALGIDGASHQGALDANGKTIAVTGNGLDRVYPTQHRDLAHQIVENGALVSEFPPATKPLPNHFPRRNRIIAGLSLGTLVVEATQKSGSLITACKALEQSREVFAIPGSIHNPMAKGCHQLIRQGAKLVETAQDILEELPPMAQASLDLSTMAAQSPPDNTAADAPVEASHQLILDAMAYDPVSVDTLISRTGMTSSAISSILLILELEGKISSQKGGYYVRSRPPA